MWPHLNTNPSCPSLERMPEREMKRAVGFARLPVEFVPIIKPERTHRRVVADAGAHRGLDVGPAEVLVPRPDVAAVHEQHGAEGPGQPDPQLRVPDQHEIAAGRPAVRADGSEGVFVVPPYRAPS